jgi:hypothetical protein
MTERDCIFLLADKNMRASFEGFFSRPDFYRSLECGRIHIDPDRDIVVAAGDNDPGLYLRAHELLRPYQVTHRHAVVALDAEWEGSPGADDIRSHMESMISANGWHPNQFAVIVIDPELENWIWQRSVHISKGIGFENLDDLLADPDLRSDWPKGQYKPLHPKETLETILRKRRIPRSSAIYKQITSQVSVRGCRDDAFLFLVQKMREWFPAGIDKAVP